MAKELSTLYELCLNRTAVLLRNSYWNVELPLSHNSFAFLPSSIIDTLIVYICETSTRYRPLLSSDLRLLLKSGRVRKCILKTMFVASDQLQNIFLDLSSACCDLTAIQTFSLPFFPKYSHIVTDALNCLLRKAHNLKCIKTWIEFDLGVLSNAEQLEEMELLFPLKNPICGFLETNGHLRPHTSLKHLILSKQYDCVLPPYTDIAVILKYCTELISINCDIAKCLEHLHAEELHKGILTHKYKIQDCSLGICIDTETHIASRDAILIASLTCPDLQNVVMCVNDDDASSALSNCRNLRTLKITWETRQYYTVAVQPLFDNPETGRNLKSLTLLNVPNVDFPSIGICCPNLEKLVVRYVNEDTGSDYSPTSFKKLEILELSRIHFRIMKNDTLIEILSNAANLKDLSIEPADSFTDCVLKDILKRNDLSKLECLYVPACGLSLSAWRNLARSIMPLYVFVSCLHFEKIYRLFSELNPTVVVNTIETGGSQPVQCFKRKKLSDFC